MLMGKLQGLCFYSSSVYHESEVLRTSPTNHMRTVPFPPPFTLPLFLLPITLPAIATRNILCRFDLAPLAEINTAGVSRLLAVVIKDAFTL